MRLSCVFAQQAVAVLHRAAAFADLPQGLQFPDGREVVLPRVAQEPPGVLRGQRRVAELRERLAAAARLDRLGEELAKGVDVLAPVGLDEAVGLRHAVQLDDRRLEIVRHACDALRADDVHIGIVGLGLGQLAVDMPLGDVEHHAVLERAVALQPPGVLVVPHPHGLGIPSLEFRLGIPACDVHVVHAAVVERGAFVFVALARSQSRSHVADPDDGQFADLALGDEIFDRIVIPGVAQVEVHRREQGRVLGQLDGLPFVFDTVGNGFFSDDVLARGESPLDLRFARVGQSEQPHDLHFGIVENNLFVIHNLRPGGQLARQVPRFGADVADVRNVPPAAFLHLVEVETSHSAEADKANFYRIHRVVNKVD